MGTIGIVLLVIAGWLAWTRMSALERRIDQLEKALAAWKRAVQKEHAQAPVTPAASEPQAAAQHAPVAASPFAAAPVQHRTWQHPPAAPPPDHALVRLVRDYFTGGNLVVRVGIVVLFFGVGFLLKYAAEHTRLSIEVRMLGVAVGALALFALGWKLRERRRGFALALQGGAVGILYLTLFAALQLYELLPAGMTFVLMAGLGVALCLLAVRQDSLALAMLGVAGGFLAPVLASTGEGNHVVLFSYYALLNLFIVVQAWFKAWRPLNLLAFVFTFGVGTVWGVMRYEPTQFATTEPFLLYFFAAFTAIAVLFAHRTAPRLTHYVDGTLVFGTPAIATALQMQLVRDFEHGRAWSAVGAGVLYLALAAWLQRTQRDTLRLLKESFLALGVAFLTLAVPLWFDDSWTVATWALEGAALVWIGLRQQRWLPTGSGVALQFAAAVVHVMQLDSQPVTLAVLNARCLDALVLAMAGLLSARFAMQHASWLKVLGKTPSNLLLGWGLCWWLYAGGHEIWQFVPVMWQSGALLGWCAATALAAAALVRPLSWPALRVPALLILPVMIVAALVWFAKQLHPASEGGWLAWPAAFGVLWLALWWHESSLSDRNAALLHGLAAWLFVLLVSWELRWQIGEFTDSRAAWTGAAWGLAPTALLAVLGGALVQRWWPLHNYPAQFRGWIASGLAALLLAWSLWLNGTSDASAAPLLYAPLANPLDIAVALALLAIVRWLRSLWRSDEATFTRDELRTMLAMVTAVTFFWLNAMLLRTMHHWGGVPFTLAALTADTTVQAALSIFWTLLALGAMLWANRVGSRVVWYGGAALMAVVVAKLFLVDLVRVGTVPRIVSFLVVGGLMLVIGYFSPLPPARNRAPA